MIVDRLIKRFRNVPPYVSRMRFFFTLRSLFKKYFKLPIIIKTKRGSWIYLGMDVIDDIILKDLYHDNQFVYFPKPTDFEDGDVVLDVGAHHGIYAVELAGQLTAARIFSFEPDHTSFRYLRFNLRLNSRKNVRAINAALGSETSAGFIVKSDEGSWGNYVTNGSGRGVEEIQIISVGDFVKKEKIDRVSFVKLNAEGAEFAVLPAMFDAAIFPKTILLFGHPEKGDLDALLRRVTESGYEMVRTNNNAIRPWYIFQNSKV